MMVPQQNSISQLINLEENTFNLVDQVHTLGNIPRFAGKTHRPYTVLDHIMNGLPYCEDDEQRRYWLLHESFEGLTGLDVPTPLKKTWPWYQQREEEYLRWVYSEHGLFLENYDYFIKKLDGDMLVTEEHNLFDNESGYDWFQHGKILRRVQGEPTTFIEEYQRLFPQSVYLKER